MLYVMLATALEVEQFVKSFWLGPALVAHENFLNRWRAKEEKRSEERDGSERVRGDMRREAKLSLCNGETPPVQEYA